MALESVSDAEFQTKVLDSTTPVFVDFWAEWCAPCRMLAPVIEAVSVKYQGKLNVFKLDTDANPETANNLQITGLPTCIIFKGGKEVGRIVGFRSQDAIEEELLKVLS